MENHETPDYTYPPGSVVSGVIKKGDTIFLVDVEVGTHGTTLNKWELLEEARMKLKGESVEMVLTESKCSNSHVVSLSDKLIFRYQEAPPEQIAELIPSVEETPQAQEIQEKQKGLWGRLFGK